MVIVRVRLKIIVVGTDVPYKHCRANYECGDEKTDKMDGLWFVIEKCEHDNGSFMDSRAFAQNDIQKARSFKE